MKIRDILGISDKSQERISRVMQILLLAMTAGGFYIGNTGIAVNSLVGLLVTFVPGILEKDYEVVMDPALVLWVTSAVFLHAAGTLGPYKAYWWYDHMTHTLSASVVAGAGYAFFRALDVHTEELYFPDRVFFAFILIFVMAFGVVWELLEFGISGAAEMLGSETVLTQYGVDDTMKDLVFDLVGGVVVAVFGEAYLLGLVESVEERLIQ